MQIAETQVQPRVLAATWDVPIRKLTGTPVGYGEKIITNQSSHRQLPIQYQPSLKTFVRPHLGGVSSNGWNHHFARHSA